MRMIDRFLKIDGPYRRTSPGSHVAFNYNSKNSECKN